MLWCYTEDREGLARIQGVLFYFSLIFVQDIKVSLVEGTFCYLGLHMLPVLLQVNIKI